MSRHITKRAAVYSAVVAMAAFAGTTVGRGQAPAPAAAPAPPAVGDVAVSGGYVLRMIQQDQDKSIAFYQDLLKLTFPPPLPTGPRVPAVNANIATMIGIAETTKARFVTARIPGSDFGVEMEEFSDIDRKMVHPRPQDPGGVTLVLLVRDIATAFAPLKAAGVPVVTPGGAPIALGKTKARAVLVSDHDGHFVELLQPDPLPATTAPPESNIIGARIRLTVADTDASLRFYRDGLAIKLEPGAFAKDPLADVMGLKGAQIRMTSGLFPGSPTGLELVEVKGVDRTPVKPRSQDPGAVRLSMRVRDLDVAMNKLKANGATIMSSGDVTALVNGARRRIVYADPNNVYVQNDPLPAPQLAQAGGGAPGGGGGGGGGGRGPAVPPLIMTSTAWEDGGVIPAKYAGVTTGVSPELKWSQVPPGTQSFVLLLHDPEPVRNKTSKMDVTHWLIWNIPGTSTGLPENVPQGELPDGTRQVGGRANAYMGMGAPAGPYHHYTFELYALDTKIDVPQGTPQQATDTRVAVFNAMDGHVLGKALLIARFHQ